MAQKLYIILIESSQQPNENSIIILIIILQRRKMKLREFKKFAQGYTIVSGRAKTQTQSVWLQNSCS